MSCQEMLKEQWSQRTNMNTENLKDQASFYMNLNTDNQIVRKNRTFRKQGENIPGGHDKKLMSRGNRRYGLGEIVKGLKL